MVSATRSLRGPSVVFLWLPDGVGLRAANDKIAIVESTSLMLGILGIIGLVIAIIALVMVFLRRKA